MTTQDEAGVQEAVKVVLSFTSTMNEWETRRYYRSRADTGYITEASDSERAGDLTAEELDSEYFVIFQKHCTKRKRTYGGFPHSWTKGGAYAGVAESTVLETRVLHPGRIEIVCKGGPFPDQHYKFVVFKKKEGWRIDSVLSRSGSEEWDRCPL